MAFESLEKIQSLLDASPFIYNSRIEAIAVNAAAQTLTLRMPLKPEFERVAGSGQFHGGPIASLIDTAGCFALMVQLEKPVPTINFRTDYLRPAVNTELTATATVRRAGKTVGVVDVDVLDQQSRLVAVGRGTFGV